MSALRRSLLTVLVALMILGSGAAVVSADRGGTPAAGSCGVGREAAHAAIADPYSPGASEVRHRDKSGCAPGQAGGGPPGQARG